MHSTGYIGRKMRLPQLQEKPAIIIAAFGSSRRGKAALDLFDKSVKKRFEGYDISWAYTSSIIRKKTGLPSLHQGLANAESAGFRRAVVLPLQIFPGTEYQEIAETAHYFPGMRVVLGETLLHRWDFVNEVLKVLEMDFLSPEQGLNLLALHGTPLVSDPANGAYLGLEKMVSDKYSNVVVAALEGVPDHEAVLARIEREKLAEKYARLRIIPMMFLGGLHVEDDLMGEGNSWRQALVRMGFTVDCPTLIYEQEQYFKSMAFSPDIVNLFLQRLDRALELMHYY